MIQNLGNVLKAIDKIEGIDHVALATNFSNVLNLVMSRNNSQANSKNPERQRPYTKLVMNGRYRYCQDPRDHVFGFVGVAQHMGIKTVKVDYTLTTRQVYQHFMELALLQDSDALILLQAGCTSPRIAGLPSWVADLSQTPVALPFTMIENKIFQGWWIRKKAATLADLILQKRWFGGALWVRV